MNRGNMEKFKQETESTGGLYLKAKDCENVPRKMRPIAWVHEGKPIDLKTYLEGWVEEKGGKSRPVRFEVDDEIPEGKFKWSIGKSFGDGPGKPQTPKPTIAMLVWDYKSQTYKLAAFSQLTIIRPFQEAMEETIEGEENPLYIKDFSKVDIIISKPDKKDNKYAVSFKEVDERKDKFFTEIEPAIKDLKFSWSSFMACEDPWDEDGEISYNDVIDLIEGNPAKPNKNVKDEDEKEDNPEDDFDWKSIKTPQGILLTKLSDQKLSDLYTFLKEKGKTDGDLWKGVILAMEDRGMEGDDIPF